MTEVLALRVKRAALQMAEREAERVKSEKDLERRKAQFEIDERFRLATSASNKAVHEAKRELDAELVRQKNNSPLIGRFVERTIQQKKYSWGGGMVPVTIRGVIELCGPETRLGGNKHDRPTIGRLFVRALKEDGTPSLLFHNDIYEDTLLRGWALVNG